MPTLKQHSLTFITLLVHTVSHTRAKVLPYFVQWKERIDGKYGKRIQQETFFLTAFAIYCIFAVLSLFSAII